MRKGKWLLGVAVSMMTLVFLSGCTAKEERQMVGEAYEVEKEELTEIYLDGITEGSILFSSCSGEEAEIRKLKQYGTELLTMKLGEELSGKGKGEKELFRAYITYEEGEDKWDNTLQLLQYEDYIEVKWDRDGKEESKYYETNIDVQEAFSRLKEMIYATRNDGLLPEPEEVDVSDMIAKKPVIYLYPEKEMDIQVHLDKIALTCTYPAYQNGWNVRVNADGRILDKESLREYYCLYYEGEVDLPEERACGFIVEREGYQAFLEEKLEILGLNDREAQEFIIYWLPIMQEYDKLFVHFVEQEILEEAVPLKITPKPDSVIRVFMELSECEEDCEMETIEQKLTKVERRGYSVVEWGGSFTK